MQPPKVFISYSWEDDEHKSWVRELSKKLREDGVDVKLDQWELTPGDQIPQFMERMIIENDFILVVCTPSYKIKSDSRVGGVGYEGDIMTGLKLATNNQRKFIPIIKKGNIENSSPNWLKGVFSLDFTNDMSSYDDLHATLTNSKLKKKPPLGMYPRSINLEEINTADNLLLKEVSIEYKILGIISDEVELGRHDGSAGSSLDKIPFLLSGTPDLLWTSIFLQNWDRPLSFTGRHRPGIASIIGNKLYLSGTTLEEVRDVHRATLQSVISVTNNSFKELIFEQQRLEEEKIRRNNEIRKSIQDISKDINFD
jgi:hypothetical protein